MCVTVTAGAALVSSEHRVGTGGHRAGDQHTHLSAGMTETVSAAVVPPVSLLEAPAAGRQTEAGGDGDGDAGAGDPSVCV